MPWPPEDRVLAVLGRVLQQTGLVEPASELGLGELCLEPGERGAETVVGAAAEAQVLVVVPGGDEPVGVGEALRIPVAGREDQPQRGALGDDGPAEQCEHFSVRWSRHRSSPLSRGTLSIASRRSCET